MRLSPILQPWRERTAAKKTSRDAPTEVRWANWSSSDRATRSSVSGVAGCSRTQSDAGLDSRRWQPIAIRLRLPSGSTRSSRSSCYGRRAGRILFWAALDWKARISASSRRGARWPLSNTVAPDRAISRRHRDGDHHHCDHSPERAGNIREPTQPVANLEVRPQLRLCRRDFEGPSCYPHPG